MSGDDSDWGKWLKLVLGTLLSVGFLLLCIFILYKLFSCVKNTLCGCWECVTSCCRSQDDDEPSNQLSTIPTVSGGLENVTVVGGASGVIGHRDEVRLKVTGVTATVPNNSKAKLMYYLKCVGTVLEIENNLFTDYNNYSNLTSGEIDALLVLVVLLSPDELIGKVFFPSDSIDSSNEFLELSAARTTFAVTENMAIAGQTRKVKKIMLFKHSWIVNNYLNPLKSFESRLRQIAER